MNLLGLSLNRPALLLNLFLVARLTGDSLLPILALEAVLPAFVLVLPAAILVLTLVPLWVGASCLVVVNPAVLAGGVSGGCASWRVFTLGL